MDLRVTQSNQAFLNDVKSFEALKTNLINARLEAMKDIKDVYKIPKSQNMPLSQSLTQTGRVINQDDLIKIVDGIYRDLDMNKFMSPDMRELYGQNLIFKWNQIVNKALRDNIISKTTLNDFNTNVKANIRGFVSGLKGLNVGADTTKEIKEMVETQMNQMLSELKELEKQRQSSMNVQDINQIDEKIIKLNQAIVSLSSLGIPLSQKLFSSLMTPFKPQTSTTLIVPQARPSQQQQQGIVIPHQAKEILQRNQQKQYDDIVKKNNEIDDAMGRFRSQYVELTQNNPNIAKSSIDKIFKENIILSGIYTEFIREYESSKNPDVLNKLQDLNRDREKNQNEVKNLIDTITPTARKTIREDLFIKYFGNRLNVTNIESFLDKTNNDQLKKDFQAISGIERKQINESLTKYFNEKRTFENYSPPSKNSQLAKDIANAIQKDFELKGGYFVNPPSHTVEKYADTYNKPETKEQSAKRMKKMTEALQERNFTKISF